ncbi:hypothetical protein Tco_1393410 [Tanacetum coccineum]
MDYARSASKRSASASKDMQSLSERSHGDYRWPMKHLLASRRQHKDWNSGVIESIRIYAELLGVSRTTSRADGRSPLEEGITIWSVLAVQVLFVPICFQLTHLRRTHSVEVLILLVREGGRGGVGEEAGEDVREEGWLKGREGNVLEMRAANPRAHKCGLRGGTGGGVWRGRERESFLSWSRGEGNISMNTLQFITSSDGRSCNTFHLEKGYKSGGARGGGRGSAYSEYCVRVHI